MKKDTIQSLVEQHYDKGIVVPIASSLIPGASVNALMGVKLLNGTERAPLVKHEPKAQWLFRYEGELLEDIAQEEAENEAWINQKELRF